ncbi:MAG: UvrD-helicase domain-containing protein [Planctomycetes bacterium]|nr:UvrD-helicase domain-containing protein [Planctomycetota bacterium]
MNLTDSQRAAVEHRGSNLLVAASAGSGKTEVLARRCMSLIADPQHPCRVDRLLVVTFTRAAAAELRARVGRMLRETASETRDHRLRDHLRRQEVLVDVAEIGTIDAWCARVVREHFTTTEGGIDPAFGVLGGEQATLLRNEVLDQLFEWVYTADDELAEAARAWILRHSKPSDAFLREIVLELNRYREHLTNPDQWIARQLELHSRGEAEVRSEAARLLADALRAECAFQREQLDGVITAAESPAARDQLGEYRASVAAWCRRLDDPDAVDQVVGDITTFKFPGKARDCAGRDAALREEVKGRWFEKRLKKRWDPEWVENVLAHAGRVAELVVTLLRLQERYRVLLDAKKRARGAYEFGDVLRMALDLLGTPAEGRRREPTPIAHALQRRYEHILVDEYQDTSPVQVELLRLVTRSEPGRSNRFVVGDVKQSIYGFREAEPRLFADQINALQRQREPGRVLLLTDNFRSHRDLLEGLNELFAALFDLKLGGTGYAGDERLCARRDEIANATLDGKPRIELELVFDDSPDATESDETNGDELPLQRIQREARVAAQRIGALLEANTQIPERLANGGVCLRPLRLADIVILLRSAKGNASLLAGVLRKAGIPCVAAGRESILDSLEVQDVRCAMTLLVNRQQDVVLASYLRGPMVGLSDAQLLEVRRAAPGAGFLGAVEAYRLGGPDRTLAGQLDRAVAQLDCWRAAARMQELPPLLRRILRDTGHVLFARALPGGEHRVAMLGALETLAVECSGRGQQGVAEFVEHLDALIEQDVQPVATPATGEDVVRIMTIHAAKGLEFPVVFLLNSGAAFSRRPRRGALECDEQCGIGLDFFDYPDRARLVSAAFGVNRQAATQRELEEELRLLYVAATRAREQLVIVGHTSGKKWEELYERCRDASGSLPLVSRLSATSMLEWVMMGVASGRLDSPVGDARPLVRVEAHAGGIELPNERALVSGTAVSDANQLTDADHDWIERGRIAVGTTPNTALAQRPAVLSVSAVKQQAARTRQEDVPLDLDLTVALRRPTFAGAAVREDGRSIGEAYHRFMQLADLTRLTSAEAVRRQLAQLVSDGRLSEEQVALLSADDLTWFAGTDEGRRVADNARTCRRELPFVYALPLGDDDERIVLRGVIDLLLEIEAGLVVLDYKTDRPRDEADWRCRIDGYSVQLQLYAAAAREIFGREVVGAALIFLREHCVVPVPIEPPTLETLLARAGGVEPLA